MNIIQRADLDGPVLLQLIYILLYIYLQPFLRPPSGSGSFPKACCLIHYHLLKLLDPITDRKKQVCVLWKDVLFGSSIFDLFSKQSAAYFKFMVFFSIFPNFLPSSPLHRCAEFLLVLWCKDSTIHIEFNIKYLITDNYDIWNIFDLISECYCVFLQTK